VCGPALHESCCGCAGGLAAACLLQCFWTCICLAQKPSPLPTSPNHAYICISCVLLQLHASLRNSYQPANLPNATPHKSLFQHNTAPTPSQPCPPTYSSMCCLQVQQLHASCSQLLRGLVEASGPTPLHSLCLLPAGAAAACLMLSADARPRTPPTPQLQHSNLPHQHPPRWPPSSWIPPRV
jgi:hypothetical protein